MAAIYDRLQVFSGTANPELSRRIAYELDVPLGKVEVDRFHDGEVYVRFEDTVRGKDVFLVQPTGPPVDMNLMELLVMMDAVKRASGARINAVIPYYGYARQEKKDMPREPITAKLVADILTSAGADRVMALDLHADAIQGFFNIPVDHLTARPLMCDYIASKKLPDLVVVSPDEGMAKKARRIANILEAPLAIGYKFHPEHKKTSVTHLAGDVKGRTCVIVEDMISTGGSMMAAVDMLLAKGANPDIHIMATHGLFTDVALERLSRPEVAEVVVTNSLPQDLAQQLPKISVIDVAPLFAEAIRRVHENESIAGLFRPVINSD
ncbi:MAG TPA: ribose-phosphate pyrophosphokinase [Armatimonadota bacterium]|jgi:ribose-phosphate pyrophosphokinase